MPNFDEVIELPMTPAWRTKPGRWLSCRPAAGTAAGWSFPAETLRRLVTRDGVHGHFRLTFTEAGRFCAIRRLGAPRLHPMNKAGGWCPGANPLIL